MISRDRLALLLLWCKRSGMDEGNARKEWAAMDDWTRDYVYAWADRELTPTEDAA